MMFGLLAPTQNQVIFPGSADPKLSQVNNLPCRIFVQQRQRVITMDMIGRIRHLQSRKKKSERNISRITGLSPNTVAK